MMAAIVTFATNIRLMQIQNYAEAFQCTSGKKDVET